MRVAIIAVSLALGLVTAEAEQVAPKSRGSAAQNSIGHSVIPEKIGRPLRRGLTKLRRKAPERGSSAVGTSRASGEVQEPPNSMTAWLALSRGRLKA